MNYIPTNTPIRLEWTVKKGIGNVVEDFSRSEVFLFIETDCQRKGEDRWAVPCQAHANGLITASWSKGQLATGTYHLDLIWYKGDEKLRSIQRTKKVCAFTVDEYVDSVGSECIIKIDSVAAPYGYDGLSAYEIALIRGNILPGQITEREWANAMWKIEQLESELAELQSTTGKIIEPMKPLAWEDGRLVLNFDGNTLYVQNGKLHAKVGGSLPPSPGGGGTTSPSYSEGEGIRITDDGVIEIEADYRKRWNAKQDMLPYYQESYDGHIRFKVEGNSYIGAEKVQDMSFKGIPNLFFDPGQINWEDICNINMTENN